MESENFEGAVTDITKGLDLQKNLLEPWDRKLSETFYKLGLAQSMNNQTDEAIVSYNSSLEILKTKIERLKDENKENNEIKDLEQLIPEIEEKVADLKSYKEEVCVEIAKVVEALHPVQIS